MATDHDTALERVRRVVAAEIPGVPRASIALLGSGLDHHAFLVDDEIVVRLARVDDEDDADEDERMRREAELLRAVAEVSPVPVPEPLFVADGCIAYRLLPGVPLLGGPAADRERHAVEVARTLGTVLAALWTVPIERASQFADVVDAPLTAWRDESEEIAAALGDALPAAVRPKVEAFLRDPVPPEPGRLALTHHDLGVEHVLVDPATGRVSGIIDWSDAAITDPAKDLGLILRDLGEDAFAAALATSGSDDPGVRERALFHARCLTLGDLAFGLEHDRRAYVDLSLEALGTLF